MATAFIYPGQGAQYVGMAKDLYDAFPKVKEIYKKANDILGFDLAAVSFNGPDEKLKQTFITQPAIFTHSYVLTVLLKHKLSAEYTAGHSLGEYSALVYAGALDFESGLKLVKLRGELMQQAGELQKGTMAAVLGLEEEALVEICSEASSEGIVQVANFNSPGQIVISGSIEGVKRAMVLAKEKKAKLVKELVVHGAFHSPLMEPAKEKLKEALDNTGFDSLMIPVYSNVSAEALTPVSSPDELRQSLLNQLTSSVRWEQSVMNMIKDGADEFIELGPGKVLQGLVKRINDKVDIKGFDKVTDLDSILVSQS
ncbi:MAG: ACP S-malonyltransferase [Ignavibacteria bacterium]